LNLNVKASSITKAILEGETMPHSSSKCSRRLGGGGSCTPLCLSPTINLVIKTMSRMGTTMQALMDILLALGKTLRNTISSGLNGRKCVTSSI
jgi:hypothetical protein